MKDNLSSAALILVLALGLFVGCAHKDLKSGPSPPEAGMPSSTASAVASAEASTPEGEIEASASEESLFGEFEDEFQQVTLVADPLEPYNRAIFYFNDKLYFWVINPLAKGYNVVIPSVARIGVKNFFSNLMTPARLVSCILQGRGTAAGTELGRFAVNTTFGVLGFWDPALIYLEWEIQDEDLGQTLGAYGIGNGFFIVWPILGASTLRDSVGFVGDLYLNPLWLIDSTAWSVGLGIYRRFNDLSFRIGEYETIKKAAIDPYRAVRDGYIQFRNALIEE
jgi:phospholipid-binding lipoprotein MlaA